MISDISLTTSNSNETYEEARHRLKYGWVSASFLLFKSTVGLGAFSYIYIIGKAGIVLSMVLCAIIGFFTTYSMWRMAILCDLLDA